jgi:NAD(P)-dependent dehydrogenase (short-subunit alcohol dehydrogenase family)
MSKNATASDLNSMKIYNAEVMKGKVVLITGGSNGGMLVEMAKAYLMHGATAVGMMARKAEKLQE